MNINELIAENQNTETFESTAEPVIEKPIEEEVMAEQKEIPKAKEQLKETNKFFHVIIKKNINQFY